MHHADATRREVNRIHTKSSTGAVHRFTDLFRGTNGGRHGRQPRSACTTGGGNAPLPPSNVLVFHPMGKSASLVHGQGLLDHGTRKMVDFHFGRTRIEYFSERSQRCFANHGQFIVHEKGANWSASSQGQDA